MRSKQVFIFLIGLALSLTTDGFVRAQTSVQGRLPSGVRLVTTVEGITEYSFPNGLRVLLFPDQSKQTTTVNITYLVGSRNEGYGEAGMAHLLEHMAFKGTPSHREIPKLLDQRGASFNATTSYDRTNYFETFPAGDENLKWMLDFEADRMVNSFIAQRDLDSEMTVVRNEFEMGENSPTNVLEERMMSAAYLAHAYHRPIIGFRADIENVPIERLQAFYKKYYQPDNAVLTIAGNFNEPKALVWITETFGKIRKPERTLTKPYTLDPVQDGERTVVLRRVGDTQMVGSLYHVPDGAHPDFAAINILAKMLGEAPSGRLYQTLVETNKASKVAVEAMQFHDPGVLQVLATLPKNGDIAVARDAMLQTVEEFAKHPPTKEEVQRARRVLLKDMELTLRNSDAFGYELSEWIALGDWRLFFLDRDRLRNVTPEDVQRVAAKYLISSNRTLGLFIPVANPLRAEIPPRPDLTLMLKNYKGEAPVFQGETFDPTPTNIESRTKRIAGTSGIKVALLPKPTRGHLVRSALVLHFGDENSLANLSTVGELTAEMLKRGTHTHTRQQLKDDLDRLKAEVWFEPDVGQLIIGIQTVRESLPEVMNLVAEMIKEPSFPANEFEALQREKLVDLQARLSDPTMLAITEFQRRVHPYPAGHPRYQPTLSEKIDQIKAISLAAVKKFHADFYGANFLDVSVVGDFDEQVITKLTSDLFGGWKSPQPFVRVAERYFETAGQRTVTEVADKANATYVLGLSLNLRDDDPDYPALVVADHILGGGALHSRLADRIRQKEGLSYAVQSALSAGALDRSGLFLAFAIFAPQNLERLETAFKEELEMARTKGFTEDELKAAKSAWLESQRVYRASDDGLAPELAEHLFYNRTFVWDAELEKKVAAVTAEQAASALRKYIDPAKLTIVAVGSFGAKSQ